MAGWALTSGRLGSKERNRIQPTPALECRATAQPKTRPPAIRCVPPAGARVGRAFNLPARINVPPLAAPVAPAPPPGAQVAFLDVIAVKHGLNMMQKLGGIRKIQAHVACLTEWLYARLASLRHSNGAPMLAIFGKHNMPNHRQVRHVRGRVGWGGQYAKSACGGRRALRFASPN
jgi:hypothetical protein